MKYKETKYNFIVVGSDGEVYTNYYPGYTKKKCSLRKGIKTFRIKHGGYKKSVGVAKLVGESYIENPNKYRYVLTKDGDEMNTHPDNLYWSKSNRMNYKDFAEKKKGMVYKSYVDKNIGCYTVIKDNIKDNIKECVLECSNCKDSIIIDRSKIRTIKGICNKVKYKLYIESLSPSEAFKNWKIVKEVGTENLPKSYKMFELECLCCKETKVVKFNSLIKNDRIVYCNKTKKIRLNLQHKLKSMKQRCHNPNNSDYIRYGAKGITVCDEWRKDSEKFIEWSLENKFDFGKEIDRIDNSKEYSPNNCQYLTKEEHKLKHLNTK